MLRARQPVEVLVAALRAHGLEPSVEDGAAVVQSEAREDAPALLRALLAEGIDVYESTPITASLEDIFLEAVKA